MNPTSSSWSTTFTRARSLSPAFRLCFATNSSVTAIVPGDAQPSLKIKFSRVETGRIESPKRLVRKNIDPEDFQIFAREIRQRHEPSHERRRSGDAGCVRGHRENRLGKVPGRRRDLQVRFAGHHIDRGGKRAIRALIGDLGREINRDSERDAQDIQDREQRMPAQVTENVPAKNAKILRRHIASSRFMSPQTYNPDIRARSRICRCTVSILE